LCPPQADGEFRLKRKYSNIFAHYPLILAFSLRAKELKRESLNMYI